MRINRRIIILSTVVVISTFSNPLRAENNISILNGYTLTIGLTIKELNFNYYRLEDDIDPAGTMTEGMYATWFIRAGTPYIFSKNRKWGYYIETGTSDFSMSKQNVGYEEINLGTAVSGRYWYLTPVAFHVFGQVTSSAKSTLSLLTGIGVGIGYLKSNGSMILTENGSHALHPVDVNGLGIAVTILLEARYGQWTSRIYGGGPHINEKESTYSAFDFSWDFGYSYTF